MKVIKYIGSILFDIMQTIIVLALVLIICGIVAVLTLGLLYVVFGSSNYISNLCGGSGTVYIICIVLWIISFFSIIEGSNPIKRIIEVMIGIKNYLIDKWYEV